MIALTAYKNKNVYVLGLGKTGVACANALRAGGANVYVWDDNPKTQAALAANLQFRSPEQLPWHNIDALIMSPGIPTAFPAPHPAFTLAKQHGVAVLSDIELLAHAQSNANFIGVTGTNGKSTTTSLIGHILQESGCKTEVGGNIGTPVLELKPLAHDGFYVLEMSSFQLELLHSMAFNVAILLNISSDHANRYQTYNDYIAAKKLIFKNGSGTGIISVDCPETRDVYLELQAQNKWHTIAISTQKIMPGAVCILDDILYDNSKPELPAKYSLPHNSSLLGKHNHENMAAAYAACVACGVPSQQIIRAFATFKGLDHRMQIVYEDQNVRYVNDSKGTNSNSTAKALQTFDNIIWIAGGMSKDDDFATLMQYKPHILHVYLVGSAQDKFAPILAEAQIAHEKAETLANTMHLIKQALPIFTGQKVTVLLSPVCASWDQWPDYIARGNAFKQLVLEMTQ